MMGVIVVVRPVVVDAVEYKEVTLRGARVEVAIGETGKEGDVVRSIGSAVRDNVQVQQLCVRVTDAVAIPWDAVALTKLVVLTEVDHVVVHTEGEASVRSVYCCNGVNRYVRCDQVTGIFVGVKAIEGWDISTAACFVRWERYTVAEDATYSDQLNTDASNAQRYTGTVVVRASVNHFRSQYNNTCARTGALRLTGRSVPYTPLTLPTTFSRVTSTTSYPFTN